MDFILTALNGYIIGPPQSFVAERVYDLNKFNSYRRMGLTPQELQSKGYPQFADHVYVHRFAYFIMKDRV